MKHTVAIALLLAASTLLAQMPAAGGEVKRTPYYVDPLLLDLSTILPLPPTQGSETTTQELAYVHRIEQTRTPAQVAQVRQDDKEEDLFIFTT
jgi:acid phosphatase (class A)